MPAEPIIATYRIQAPAAQAQARAEALAVEQSIEMPPAAVMNERVLREVIARVLSVRAVGDDLHEAQLALSAEAVTQEPGQLMNMLFGNSSLLDDVTLIDVEVPEALATTLGGPSHGIDGLRARCHAYGRPLTCTALKPIGSTVAELAQMTAAFARAGLDIIKDDHGWADHSSAPFFERVGANQAAVDAANRGRTQQTIYAPSLFGSLQQMTEQVRFAMELGVGMVLVAPMNCGPANFHALRRAFPSMAFLAHPAQAGRHIAPPALLGKLMRLFGADAVIFPNHGGRFTFSRATCEAIAHNNRTPWFGLKPALPTPAGGMTVERVPEMVADYGQDVLLLIGGSLLSARERLEERSREFVAAVARAGEVKR